MQWRAGISPTQNSQEKFNLAAVHYGLHSSLKDDQNSKSLADEKFHQ